MDTYNKQIEELLKEITQAVNTFIENKNNCTSEFISNLFGINCTTKSSVQEILGSMTFNGLISEFFNLILSKLEKIPILTKDDGFLIPYSFTDINGNLNLAPIYPSENEMVMFQEILVCDLIMMLLKDATLNLGKMLSENSIDGEKWPFRDDIFFQYSDFKKGVCELAALLDFKEPELKGLEATIEQYKDFIHLKAPKISFPWIAFCLCKTYMYLPVNFKKSEFYLVKEKLLSLKSIGRNQYHNTHDNEEILSEAQKIFIFFIEYLTNNNSRAYPFSNKSFSLYLFNEITNLFDLHTLFTNFCPELINSSDSKKIKLDIINNQFVSLSNMSIIKPFGVKRYLIDNIDHEYIYSNKDLWKIMNYLFEIMRTYVYCIIEEGHLVESINFLSLDHYLYDQLHEAEPYTLKGIDKVKKAYQSISEDDKAAYFFAYKNIYKSKFPIGKNKYIFENY
jgi:hypothetical protein